MSPTPPPARTYQQAQVEPLGSLEGSEKVPSHLLGVAHGGQHADPTVAPRERQFTMLETDGRPLPR